MISASGRASRTPRRAGRQVFYRLDDAQLRLLLNLSTEHVGHGGEQ